MILIGLIAAVCAPGLRAEALRCAVCQLPIRGKFFQVEDKVNLEKKSVCPTCSQLDTWCFVCNVPMKDGFTRLADGRIFCARDLQNAILTEDQARGVWAETREGLRSIFFRFLSFPQTNVHVGLVDKLQLETAFKSPGYNHTCGAIFGATQTRQTFDEHYEHKISLLNGVNKSRLMAVLAHEYGHAWVRENLRENRGLSSDAEEGFCEWVAYKLMEHQNEADEMKVIAGNLYTRGQIQVFLEADHQFGIYPVVEWLKRGVDPQVELAQVDRFRMVQAKQASAAGWNLPSAPAPRVANSLVLQGISGPPTRRMALINNRPLLAREEAKVQLANSNVTVRVLQILEKSVIVSLNGSSEPQELGLSTTTK